MRYALTALAAGTTLLWLTGCGGGSSSGSTVSRPTTQTTSADGLVTSTPRSFDGLQFTLTTNKATYAKGEGVQCTLTVTNTSTQEVTMQGVGGPDGFLVYQGSTLVFPNSGGSTGQSYTLTWTLGEAKTFSLTWPQVDGQGNFVSAGTYSLVYFLNPLRFNNAPSSDQQNRTSLASNPVNITITQ